LVGWATNIASVPMMLSGVLNRVAFPAYSRLQSDPEALGRYLGASIRRISAVFSLVIPLVVIACPVAIPALFHARWVPAIPLVQWFSLECIIVTLTGLLASTQNAMGYSSERLIVTVIVGSLRWGFGYLAVRSFGLLGIGPTMFLLSLTEMVASAVLVMRRNSGCSRIMQETLTPLLAVGAMLTVALGLGWTISHHNVLIQTLIALLVFAGLLALREVITGGRVLNTELRAIYGMLRPRQVKA